MKKYLLFTLFFVTPLFASKPEVDYLKITKVKGAAVLIQGKAGEAVITATVANGMHIQSNPASKPNLVSTQVTFEGNSSFEIGIVQYPASKPYRLLNTDTDIQTYDGTIEIKVPLKAIPDKAKLGKNEVNAKLRYQACNDKTCFFPSTIKFTIPVMVYK